MVQGSLEGNLRLRPPLYVSLRMSIDHEAKHRMEHQYSIPPTD